MAIQKSESRMMSLRELVEMQVLVALHQKKVHPTKSQVGMFSVLAEMGKRNITDVANQCSDENIFDASQSARNALMKASKDGHVIVSKQGSRTMVELNPEYNVVGKDESIIVRYSFGRRK